MKIKFITDIIKLIKTHFRVKRQSPGSELVVRSKRYVTIDEIYAKHYGTIDYSIFCDIVKADPTYSPDVPDKMGKYGKWLLSLYQKATLLTEDLYKAHSYLDCFNRFRRRLTGSKDINQIKSLPDLYDLIKEYLNLPEEFVNETTNEEQRIKENEARRLFEDKDWLVIQPLTEQAAIIYGRGTQWCTSATRSYNYFERYNSQGPLFILISKKNNRKYQLHFESQTYCDETDRSIPEPIAESIDMTIALAQFCQSRGWYDLFRLEQPVFQQEDNRFIKLDDKYYYFKSNGKIIDGITADSVERYSRRDNKALAIYLIMANKKYNLISCLEENTLFQEWYDEIKILRRGIVITTNRQKSRVFSLDINIFFDEFIERYRYSFEDLCQYFASFTPEDRLTDQRVIDRLIFAQAKEPKDYLEYLKIFGPSALHKKQAGYEVALPIFRDVSIIVAILAAICTAIGFAHRSEAIGGAGIITFIISFAIFCIAKFSHNMSVNKMTKDIAFLAVPSLLLIILIIYGPTAFLITIAALFVLLISSVKIYNHFKFKKKK